jgi:hypothetical protein
MSTFVSNNVASGDIVKASDHNTMGASIAAVVNGGLDNNNITSGAAIATSKLADDAGITTAKLASSAVTPDKLESGTGSSWEWQTWTPTWTNLTLGNGTLIAKYTQIGKTIRGRLSLVFGTETSISGVLDFSLPQSMHSEYSTVSHNIGTGTYEDNGVSSYIIGLWNFSAAGTISTTKVRPIILTANGTFVTDNSLTNTSPFSPGSGDKLNVSFAYEAA